MSFEMLPDIFDTTAPVEKNSQMIGKYVTVLKPAVLSSYSKLAVNEGKKTALRKTVENEIKSPKSGNLFS